MMIEELMQEEFEAGRAEGKTEGDVYKRQDLDAYIDKSVKNLESILFSGLPYKKDKERFCALLERYFAYISKHVLKETSEDFVMDDLLGILQEFVGYPHISRQGPVSYTHLSQPKLRSLSP